MGNNSLTKSRRRPPIRKRPATTAIKRSSNRGSSTELALQPRERLSLVAGGADALRVEDLESVLTSHVVEADRQAEYLARQTSQLLDMVFAKNAAEKVDLGATLDLVTKLAKLRHDATRDARRTAEVLMAMGRRGRRTVQVVASQSQVNVSDQQIVGQSPVDLGGRER